jgi:hypothetical protein
VLVVRDVRMEDLGLEIELRRFEGVFGGEHEEELEVAALGGSAGSREGGGGRAYGVGGGGRADEEDAPLVEVGFVEEVDVDSGGWGGRDVAELLGRSSLAGVDVKDRDGRWVPWRFSCLLDQPL